MAILLRQKCATCGEICDAPENGTCPKCKAALNTPTDGYVQVYRMGSPIGIAVGYGMYINGNPVGYIANKQSVRVPLSYGTYTFHFTCGMTRKCEDLTVTISPETSTAYIKARIVPGFWSNKIVIETATEADMPAME